MGKIEQFEDIPVWQESRVAVKLIYELCKNGSFSRDFALRDQLRSAAVSIMSNIAEGFERKSNKELIQFLFIAKGSAGEARSLTYVAKDVGYIDDETFSFLQKRFLGISKQLSSFIKYLRSN